MRTVYFLLLSFLLSPAAHAGLVNSQGTIPQIVIGERNFTDPSNTQLKILSCTAVGPTNIRCTLAASTAPTAGYQVTAAKTLTIRAIQWRDDTPGTISTVTFYQSDNDVGQTGAATALTNGVQKSWPYQSLDLSSQIGETNEMATNFTVAASKYLTIQLSAVSKTIEVFAYGYEQ